MDQFKCVWFFQPFEMVVDSVTGDQTDWLSQTWLPIPIPTCQMGQGEDLTAKTCGV